MKVHSPILRSCHACWLSCCLGFLVAILPSSTEADDGGNELRVLCYNIHYGQGTDGCYDIERLAGVINKAKPDLVALQEVDVGVERSGRERRNLPRPVP